VELVDTFLTWLAVAAGLVGALIVLAYLTAPIWNFMAGQVVSKEHEDTSRNQGRA
jgi:hypothetical protein